MYDWYDSNNTSIDNCLQTRMTLSEILIFFSLHIQNKAEVLTTLFTQLISLFFLFAALISLNIYNG